MSARRSSSHRVAGKLCLCAEISFDGKLLAAGPESGASGPVWWKRLLARKRTVRADAASVRVMFETARVDELCLRVRPCIDGRRGQPTLSGPDGNEAFFARSITWELARMSTTPDGDCLLHYRRRDG